MSETVVLWLLGQAIFVTLIVVGGFIKLQNENKDEFRKMGERITKLESFKETFEIFGKKAIELMHSPHTPELDAIIEKYQRNQMADADWRRMLELCEQAERDLANPRFERALAAFAVIHCRKRLNMPLDPYHSHSETTL